MQATTKPSPWAAFGKFTAVLLAVAVTTIIRGLVLTVLWGWFIEPLGVPAINVPEALGIALIIGMLWLREEEEDKKKLPRDQRFLEAFGLGITNAGLVLAFGWIVHLFV